MIGTGVEKECGDEGGRGDVEWTKVGGWEKKEYILDCEGEEERDGMKKKGKGVEVEVNQMSLNSCFHSLNHFDPLLSILYRHPPFYSSYCVHQSIN